MKQSNTNVVIPNISTGLHLLDSTPSKLANNDNQLTYERTLSKHEHAYFEGDHKHYVYLVLSGVVGTYKVQLDGRRQIISFASVGKS
jgi:CRP-like cAMP-binding protein